MNKRLRADLALALIAFVWGATFIMTKAALDQSSVLLFLTLRFTIASAVLGTLFLSQGREPGGRKALLGGVAAGVCLFAGYVLQTIGLKYSTATKTGFITGLYVVVVPLLVSLVYRVVPRWLELAGLGIAVFGMALLTLPAEGWGIEPGDLLVAASTLPYAGHLLLVSRVARWSSPITLAFYQTATGAVLGASVFWWAEKPFFQWNVQVGVALAVTGLLATALAFVVLSWAQRTTTATRSALLLTLEPLFAWLTSVVVAGEQLSGRAAIGAILILAGILAVELKPLRPAGHPSG